MLIDQYHVSSRFLSECSFLSFPLSADRNFDLTGSIPSEIGTLKNLTDFHFSKNHLIDDGLFACSATIAGMLMITNLTDLFVTEHFDAVCVLFECMCSMMKHLFLFLMIAFCCFFYSRHHQQLETGSMAVFQLKLG